jgi:nucleoside-diphosphate-sugar epimerase
MKILVIGGSGILSSAVVDRCIELGHEITMLNRGRHKKYINPKANLIICDVNNDELVLEKLQGLYFDVIIDFIVFNKEQLAHSLQLFGNIAKQYVFISSAQAYNTSIKKILTEDAETPQPLWSYSVNKDICEKYLVNYCSTKNINYTIVRPGVNYDNRRIPYGMYPPIGMHWTIVSRILAGKPIITWNGAQNKLNLTRVEDFANGMVGLLGNPSAYNNIFNVVGDNMYKWQDVLDTLGELLDLHVRTVDIPLELYAKELNQGDREMLVGGRAQDLCCSNSKLKQILPEFRTQYDLKSGLQKTLIWYKENNYYNGFDYIWDAQCDRVIHQYDNSYKGKFVNYSQNKLFQTITNLCVYKTEYFKNDKLPLFIWKVIKKLMKLILKFKP